MELSLSGCRETKKGGDITLGRFPITGLVPGCHHTYDKRDYRGEGSRPGPVCVSFKVQYFHNSHQVQIIWRSVLCDNDYMWLITIQWCCVMYHSDVHPAGRQIPRQHQLKNCWQSLKCLTVPLCITQIASPWGTLNTVRSYLWPEQPESCCLFSS